MNLPEFSDDAMTFSLGMLSAITFFRQCSSIVFCAEMYRTLYAANSGFVAKDAEVIGNDGAAMPAGGTGCVSDDGRPELGVA